MASNKPITLSALAIACLLASGIAWTVQTTDASEMPAPASLQVSSSSFASGQSMPSKLTCDGSNLSPDIRWSTAPARTQSYAIVVDDPDAPPGFTHWLAYNIPATIHDLPEGASTPVKRLEQAAEGSNGFGHPGYGGPCPPGTTPHHYVFHVYALDMNPKLAAGLEQPQVMAAIKGHVLAEGRIVGLYGRGGG